MYANYFCKFANFVYKNVTAHILGLGESLIDYLERKPEGFTVGVNDIVHYIEPDYLVVIDRPNLFAPHRLKAILETDCKGFYSHIDSYKDQPNFRKISLSPISHARIHGKEKIYHSQNSPFVACQIAMQLGATECVLWGVDMNTHHTLQGNGAVRKAVADFKALINVHPELSIFIGSERSALSKHLPIWAK